jgi:DNA-binding transcriptional LysR family regulator
MKLQQLEYVIAIAQEGSITRAAKKLFQAQPNISIALKELEENIGIQIFNRTPNGMLLTPEGEEFLARARAIVDDVRTLEKDYKERSNQSAILRVEASRAAYAAAAVSDVINNFPAPDGDISIHIFETSMPKVLEDISNGKCDIGVVRIPEGYSGMLLERLKSKDLINKTVREYTLKLLMRADHPLAGYDDVPFEMLKQYPEVIYDDGEPDMARRAAINPALDIESVGKKVYIRDRGNQLTVISNTKNSYVWTSPMPEWLVSQVGLVVKECSFAVNINRDIVVYRKSQENNPLVKACVDTMIKFANM